MKITTTPQRKRYFFSVYIESFDADWRLVSYELPHWSSRKFVRWWINKSETKKKKTFFFLYKIFQEIIVLWFVICFVLFFYSKKNFPSRSRKLPFSQSVRQSVSGVYIINSFILSNRDPEFTFSFNYFVPSAIRARALITISCSECNSLLIFAL